MRRHDAVQYAWTAMLRSVGFQCELEKLHEFPDKRRADISVYNYKDGKKLLLDISVVNPQVPAFLSHSADSSGAAASRRDEEKAIKYSESATSLGYLFQPVVAEAFGRWSEKAIELFRDIGRRPSVDFLEDRSAFAHYWRNRISSVLQRQNARIVINKVKKILPSQTASLSLAAVASTRCNSNTH